jgi:hypothetical protein
MHYRHRLFLFVIGLLFLTNLGCVQRRLTLRSFPEGAMAYVDDQEIGQTPVSTPFTYYGTRDVRLEKDGYETVHVQERLDAPWYLTPPLDFFVENFWPVEIRDEREVEFELQPATLTPQAELLPRAEEQRRQVQQNLVVHLVDDSRRSGLFQRN